MEAVRAFWDWLDTDNVYGLLLLSAILLLAWAGIGLMRLLVDQYVPAMRLRRWRNMLYEMNDSQRQQAMRDAIIRYRNEHPDQLEAGDHENQIIRQAMEDIRPVSERRM